MKDLDEFVRIALDAPEVACKVENGPKGEVRIYIPASVIETDADSLTRSKALAEVKDNLLEAVHRFIEVERGLKNEVGCTGVHFHDLIEAHMKYMQVRGPWV
jgi:hypothetical protein